MARTAITPTRRPEPPSAIQPGSAYNWRAIPSVRTRSTTSSELFTDFQEIHGDRLFADDPAIVCGMGFLDGRP